MPRFCQTLPLFIATAILVLSASACGVSRTEKELAEMNQRNVLHDEAQIPDLTESLGGRDDCEGFNRAMWSFNRWGLKWVIRPIGYGWGTVFPRPAIRCVNNMFTNFEYPIRLFSSLLQAKFKSAGTETVRFLSNSTLGIAGLFDVGWSWFGIEPSNEDFAQVFWTWGIGQGSFLHLPLLGPSSARDGVGYIFDVACDPKTYLPIPGVAAFGMLNRMMAHYRSFDSVDHTYYDTYELTKRFYVVGRHMKHNDMDRYSYIQKVFESSLMSAIETGEKLHTTPPPFPTTPITGYFRQGKYIDTLKYLLFSSKESSVWPELSPWNSDFYFQCSRRSVEMSEERPELPYRVLYQDQPDTAPLYVLIPGTGGDCSSVEGAALGEIAFNHGYNVLLIPSTLNTNFYLSATQAPLPGDLPSDALDVVTVLDKVLKDLEKRDDYQPKYKVLSGLSLGATHVLAIAALDSAQKISLSFDRYIACSPSVRLDFSAPEIDVCATQWCNESDTSRFDVAVNAIAKFMTLAFLDGAAKKAAYDYVEEKDEIEITDSMPIIMPFTDTESKILIAYSFHVTLSELIVSGIKTGRIASPETPYDQGTTELYQRLTHLNFDTYLHRVLPYFYAKYAQPITPDMLRHNASLKQYTASLKNNPKVYVIHSYDDFIVDTEDLKWLRDTLPENHATILSCGGHMGYLPYATFHHAFIRYLLQKEPVPLTP